MIEKGSVWKEREGNNGKWRERKRKGKKIKEGQDSEDIAFPLMAIPQLLIRWSTLINRTLDFSHRSLDFSFLRAAAECMCWVSLCTQWWTLLEYLFTVANPSSATGHLMCKLSTDLISTMMDFENWYQGSLDVTLRMRVNKKFRDSKTSSFV